jgi:hypothetical protein
MIDKSVDKLIHSYGDEIKEIDNACYQESSLLLYPKIFHI